MAQAETELISPFEINIDPMKRLLLVNFEKDPDSVYIGFEPQIFDDAINGKGHLIIGWRVDGKVDVYHEASLKMSAKKYDITGKGLNNMISCNISQAFYEIRENGVQAHYSFKDLYDRTILIKIAEKNPGKRKPFGLLAPMGDAAENPSAMPLIFLQDFYFVRKKNTEMVIAIDGKQHQPDKLPLPMDGMKMYFTRYSDRPLIATLNPAFKGILSPVLVEAGAETVSTEKYDLDLKWIEGKASIKRISRKNDIYPVSLSFEDPFPDFRFLKNNTIIQGKFTIEAHPSTGSIAGEYSINKKEDRTNIVIIPSGGWKPRPTKLSLRFLYTVVRIFKKWPASYEWAANIQYENNGTYSMKSGWKRINRKKVKRK